MSIVRDILSLPRRVSYADIIVFAALGGLMYWLVLISREWTSGLQPQNIIHTEWRYLPLYTLYSLSRGLGAYICSLLFTIGYGYTMAHSKRAERFMLPLLDILQSIPILGFLPVLVLALIYMFPHSNVGLEIATLLLIFTSQVWNMTFAFYHSVKAIPNDLRDASKSFYLSKRETLFKLELPAAAIPLVWNSMMSMAGGWFFLAAAEALTLQGKDFRLPGIGSYMQVAIDEGNIPAMFGAIAAMGVMIIVLDRLLWHPLVIWSRKFRVEEMSSDPEGDSFVLDILQRSSIIQTIRSAIARRRRKAQQRTETEFEAKRAELQTKAFEQVEQKDPILRKVLGALIAVVVFAAVAYGIFELIIVFTRDVSADQWLTIVSGGGLTFARTLAAVAIGAAWTIPVGAMIGMNPRFSHKMQPVVQFIASFPAPMFFPLFILLFSRWGISIEYGSIVLMLLGTQWYMLFNIIAGASAIPTDLQEMFRSYNMPRRIWWRKLILPALFPAIVTGAVTAAGGAWNASIIAEYVTYHKHVYAAHGIGSFITSMQSNYAALGASIFTLCVMVILINKLVWRKLFHIAQDRFALNT